MGDFCPSNYPNNFGCYNGVTATQCIAQQATHAWCKCYPDGFRHCTNGDVGTPSPPPSPPPPGSGYDCCLSDSCSSTCQQWKSPSTVGCSTFADCQINCNGQWCS